MKNRKELISLFQERNVIGRGVEVGAFKGDYAREILGGWSGMLYLVDIWNQMSDEHYADSCNQYSPKQLISECIDNIHGNENRCVMIRAESSSAANLFQNQSLDFVYIDANHRYDYVKEDLQLWFPKVRVGGVLAGHDYLKIDWRSPVDLLPNGKDRAIWVKRENGTRTFAGEFGVNPAVDEFCAQNEFVVNVTEEEWWGSWYISK